VVATILNRRLIAKWAMRVIRVVTASYDRAHSPQVETGTAIERRSLSRTASPLRSDGMPSDRSNSVFIRGGGPRGGVRHSSPPPSGACLE